MKAVARTVVLTLLIVGPVLASGCITSPIGRSELLVVASAPRESGGLTVFVAKRGVHLGDDTAEFEIRYGEETIYPPGGKGAEVKLEKDGGAFFVPYSLFVVGNGEYEVFVRHGGKEVKARANVEKWVNYVYLHPFDRGSKVVVDVQLSRTTGGQPNDRVLTEGDLLLELHYRGPDGKRDKLLGTPVKVTTDTSETFTRIEIPRSRFSEGAGYYSVEPVFHNNHAKGNLWVPPDPTMKDRNPPWNWIYMSR